MHTSLGIVDLAVVAFYLIGISLFGLRFRSKDRSLRGYFLADKGLPWWAICLSIVASETSTLTIISIPGLAFTGDWKFLQVAFGYLLGRVVVSILFLPRYARGEMLTAYELIGNRFGPRLHRVSAGLFLLLRAVSEGVRIFAISIVVTLAIGTGDIPSIALICILTLFYTLEGGMAAVVWTDVLQMALYIIGTLSAVITIGHIVPGGWHAIHTLAREGNKLTTLDFTFSLHRTYTFWSGLIGGCFLTMASHGTDQLMVQRLLAARNLKESRAALLVSGVIVFIQFVLFLIIGTGMFVFYGSHGPASASGSSDRMFPSFIVQQMHHGVAGLMIAAILAAAMSNLSAAVNSLSSTSMVDFYLPFYPSTDQRQLVRKSRMFTLFWTATLFGLAVLSRGSTHVVEVGLSLASVAYGALLGIFLLGTLDKRANEPGAIVGMAFGLLINIALWLQPHSVSFLLGSSQFTFPKVAWTWFVLIGSLSTFIVGHVVSLSTGVRTQCRIES
jgi:SSS family solute:Na+ symporter